MRYTVCAVRDVKSDVYGRPFFTQSLGSAIRSFDDEVNRKHEDNMMYHHPEDFSLFTLGTFDDYDGTFETMLPKLVVTAENVKKYKLGEEVSHV